MKQLLRLLTALMLFFGLCQIVTAQRRGTTRFNSSPDQLPEWDSIKTQQDSISRSDIVHLGETRRARYRTTTEKSTSTTDDADTELKTAPKVPAYRVRGRNRPKQNTENDKNVADVTTSKPFGESNRMARRKAYQSNKHRTQTQTRNENPSTETTNKDTVSTTHHAAQTLSSRKNHANHSESSAESPVNHQPDNHRKTYGNATTRKSPTGRRYRIRVVEANSINANSPTSESEKKVSSSTSASGDSKSTLKAKKPDRDVSIDDELNYPEHFKALLKSKKSTSPPSLTSGSSRTNNFLPKKPVTASTQTASTQTTTTTASTQTESTSSVRPAYKHKKIERPNLKLLFPSLQKSSTTSTELTTAYEGDPYATDDIDTETATPVDETSTTIKTNSTVHKQVGGSKFSSKIRTDTDDLAALSALRSRSTPLVFDTLKSSTQHSSGHSDGPTTNHRFSSGTILDTPKFSARYKSGDSASSLAAYRKNLAREKPPFYTPTTPPITTQVALSSE